MVFSSVTFLFLFLPIFFVVYYALPFRLRSAWILAGSWVFYGWWRLDFLLLLVLAAISGWFAGRRIARARERAPRVARRWVALGVTTALGVLAYFKYFNFGVETLSALLGSVRGDGIAAWHVVLPIGISFYTFQIISYVVDVYRGKAPVARSFVDVAAYVSLFPQLVAGPIVRYVEIADQLRSREHTWAKFNEGALRFMVGLARKVLIADAVAPIVDAVYASPAPGLVAAWIGVAAYTIQIYFDFAAYSDMAVGMGRMLGFRFPENFDCPYHARSITEFWRRWHMTLSRWLRDYLYIPLGGNRLGPRRTVVNLMTVMALGGLWHGAAWSFVVWGLWHGGWLVAERLAGVSGERAREPEPGTGPPRAERRVVRHAATVLIVMLGWVLFRSEGFGDAVTLYAGLVGAHGLAVPPEIGWQLSTGSLVALAAGWLLVVAEPRLQNRAVAETTPPRPGRASVWGHVLRFSAYVVFVASVVRVLASSYSPFLYFQF
ncbi:MAG: MBOAT family O-acyltransferase [Spirochaetota bacterium]